MTKTGNVTDQTQDQATCTTQTPRVDGTEQGGHTINGVNLSVWMSHAMDTPPEDLWHLIGRTSWPADVDPGKFLYERVMSDLLLDAGVRFRDATLENFVVSDLKQAKALEQICNYLDHLDEHVAAGNGLVLYGPTGTGKDHLAVGAGRAAVMAGYTVSWVCAQAIFSNFRDLISAKSSESEYDLMRSLLRPAILIVYDPAPSHGQLTDFQGNSLYRVVDARYVACKPTWTTLNVSNIEEARQRVGQATIDRLRHRATAVFCSWPSARKPYCVS